MANQHRGGQHSGSGAETKDRSSSAKEKLANAKDTVQETASDLAADAKHKGKDLIDEGVERARDLGADAREAARTKADREMHRVSDGIRSIADALRNGTNQLGEDQRQYEPLVNGVARRVESLSSYIESRDVNELSRDVRHFARDHAPLFLGGAFMLGVLGARFIKSSGTEAQRARQLEQFRYQGDGQAGYSYRPTGTTGTAYEGVQRADRGASPLGESAYQRDDRSGGAIGDRMPRGTSGADYDAGSAFTEDPGQRDSERGGRNG